MSTETVLLIAWLLTLAALFCTLLGAAQQCDRLIRVIDNRDKTIREQGHIIRDLQTPANVVPLHQSDAAGRVAALIAFNQADRADWNNLTNWSKP